MQIIPNHLKAALRRLIAEQIACCCNNAVGITTLNPPVDAPVGDDPTVLVNLIAGTIVYWDGDSWAVLSSAASMVDQFGVKIDGGGSKIIAGYIDTFRAPFTGIITGWVMLETSEIPVSGSIEVEVEVGEYSNYDTTPTFVNLIPASPAIIAGVKNQATGLSIAVTDGQIIRYAVTSASNVEIIHLYLTVKRT